MQEQIQAIATVLSLLNPTICGMMLIPQEAGRSPGAQLFDITKVTVVVAIVLLLAAFAGTRLLHLFGVSLDAFMVAGGAVLAWMGFGIINGKSATATAPAIGANAKPLLSPVILFAASPGTITGVITIAAAHTRLQFPITAVVAIAIGSVILWITMLLFVRFIGTRPGGGFIQDTTSRLMGLVVLAMGVQFALTGYREFMN